jgi:hypothetical protein
MLAEPVGIVAGEGRGIAGTAGFAQAEMRKPVGLDHEIRLRHRPQCLEQDAVRAVPVALKTGVIVDIAQASANLGRMTGNPDQMIVQSVDTGGLAMSFFSLWAFAAGQVLDSKAFGENHRMVDLIDGLQKIRAPKYSIADSVFAVVWQILGDPDQERLHSGVSASLGSSHCLRSVHLALHQSPEYASAMADEKNR